MTDNLITTIREHAGAEPVPELDLTGVIARARRVRRRRSAVRGITATLAVGALVGATFIVEANRQGGETPLEASVSFAASDVELVSSAYRTGGAFSRGQTLWFSDPDYAVDLGVTIQLTYYTAAGVVVGVTNDDAGDARREYVYVGTDGSVRELNLPGSVVPGTDAQADRLAYVTKSGAGYTFHVVEASSGRELASRPFDAPYSWAGWDLPPIGLSGDYVVLGVDGAQMVMNWRTGKLAADIPGEQLPATGGGRALGGDNESHVYALGDSTRLGSTEDLAIPDEDGNRPFAMNQLSPDGRFVQTTNTALMVDDEGAITDVISGSTGESVADPVVHVTEVTTGRRITLPGHSRTYGWTPDGRLMRVDGIKVTTCDGATGNCTSRSMPDGPGKIRMAGKYLGS